MQDIHVNIPCKVVLEDFEYKRDLNLRVLLEHLSTTTISVLEEILFSPLKVSIEELQDNTGVEGEEMELVLKTLLPLNLFQINGDFLLVDKDTRKYLETLIEKFTPDFIPNLDYFRELLKHVPIHCLISWYQIPRTSNNIFNSILEKHFKTPKIYRNYIKETLADDETLASLVKDVMESEDGKVSVNSLLEKNPLSKENLEEKILFLEYHCILCSTYEIKGTEYEKYLSTFSEWQEYAHLDSKKEGPKVTISENLVEEFVDSEFSFIKDMSLILELCNKRNLSVTYYQKDELFFLNTIPEDVSKFHDESPYYLARVINKSLLLGLLVIEEDRLRQTPPAEKWLNTPIRKRTLISFKHPHNALSHKCDFSFHQHDRNIIEVQKALSGIEGGHWILFEEFISTHLTTRNSLKQASLTKVGRGWKYTTAEYDPQEISFIKTVVLDWLFESGMVITGKFQDKDCFKVSSLGYELYS